MNKSTIDILRDPEDGHQLRLVEVCKGKKRKSANLVNLDTGRIYEFVHGIPALLNNNNVTGLNMRYQKFYDKIAFIYDILNRIYYFLRHGINYGSEGRHRRFLLKEIDINSGNRVLEVAVGPGSNLRYLTQKAEYYGVDISLKMLNFCRHNLTKWGMKAEVFQAMAENLPFVENVFDVVYCIGGFNFFDDKHKALTEMIRVAKPGAKIVIIDETLRSEAEAYSKVPVMNKIYSNRETTFSLPINLIPQEMEEVNVKEIYKGILYCLSFRVPI